MISTYIYDKQDVLPNEKGESAFIFSYQDVEPEDPFLEDKTMVLSRYIDLKPVTFASAIMIVLKHYVPHLTATPDIAKRIKDALTQININLILDQVIYEKNAQMVLQLLANALKKLAYLASRDKKSYASFLLYRDNYLISTLQLVVSIIKLINKTTEDNIYNSSGWQQMTGISREILNDLEISLLNQLFPQFKLVDDEDVLFVQVGTKLVSMEEEQPLSITSASLIFSDIVSQLPQPQTSPATQTSSPNDAIVIGQSVDNGENVDPLPKTPPTLIFSDIASMLLQQQSAIATQTSSPNDAIVLGQSGDNGKNVDPIRFPK